MEPADHDDSSTRDLDSFRTGDDAEWRAIVSENSRWLFALSLRICGHPQDAEDMVQETFVAAFRARAQLKEMRLLRGWLRTICVRLCMRQPRRRADVSVEEVEAFLPAPAADQPDRGAAAREELGAVLAAMAELSPRQRACLTLSVFEEMPGDEIAVTLGISPSSVRGYIHEARHSLERLLEKRR